MSASRLAIASTEATALAATASAATSAVTDVGAAARASACRASPRSAFQALFSCVDVSPIVLVPDHDGGRPMEVNACILITHMVYLCIT